MALDKMNQVPLPEQKIVKHRIKGSVYAYYIVRTYRNAAGKPTNDRVSIGKLDESTGMLIPNRNYYEVYCQSETPEIASVKSCGVTYLLECILKELGLDKVLRQKFPELADQIIALAEYMLCEGNIMSYYEDWSDETYTYANVKLNSQQISRIFQGIDYNRRMEFFKTWIYAREQNEYIAYDVTSISSYSKGIDNLEWGYNRDKESLPQLNMAMYYGEKSLLPLYYSIYPGSIPDKTHLSYMLRDNELIGYKKTRFVMDRGFFSSDNLKQLSSAGCRFIMSVPNSLLFSQRLIDKHRDAVVNRAECRIEKGVYAKAVITEEFDMRCKVHIYYSPSKASAEEEILFERIEQYEQALETMTEPPPKSLRYDRYFKINRSKDGGFGFIRDMEKINKEISHLGFFLISETDFKSTSAEILDIYRRRDVVEKSFDELKNGLDMKRLHCQSDATAEGKMFVAFFSLILRSFMQNKLKPYQAQTNTPFPSILKELHKLKFVCTSDGRKLLSPVTKKQRDILTTCGFSSDDIPSWLFSLPNSGCMV